MRRMGLTITLSAVIGSFLGAGCMPATTPDLSGDASGGIPPPPSGRYWVDEQDGKVSYFKLADHRGEAGQWMPIAATSSAWYAGPGIYEASDAGDWALVPDTGVSSLDELLQLNDAPPGV